MPAPSYHVIDDFLSLRPKNQAERDAAAEDISVTPYWVLAVVRLALPVTYSRKKQASVTTNPSDGARLRGPTLIITDDCLKMDVRANKGSHISSLQAILAPSGANYTAAILPGDWVLGWMMNSEEKGRDVAARIKRKAPCNNFDDGLKFVGRVKDVRKDRPVDRSGGTVTLNYTLAAAGFSELDSMVFFDPHLFEASKTMGSWLAKLGKSITELLNGELGEGPGSRAALDINKVIPFFLDLLLGDGVPRRAANPGGQLETQIATGLTKTDSGEAPFAYLVPQEVGQLLGKTSRSKSGGILAYADILELVYGVQRFVNGATAPRNGPSTPGVFLPDGIDPNDTKPHKFTGKRMIGEFIPTIPDFSNKPVWTVLTQFLNPVVNEMYSCLRVNPQGKVVPTIVARQMPFSSEIMVNNLNTDQKRTLTPFLEVPRWVIHPVLVSHDGTGRSDSARFNFVHISGQGAVSQKTNNLTYQLVRNPPLRDDIDIQRSGLRPYITTVNCSLTESKLGPRVWMEVCGDWIMGQHLMLNGTLQTAGIQAPIVQGDNIEFENVVYHIEGYLHSAGVDHDGKRSFSSSLELTHGVRSDNDPRYRQLSADERIYAHLFEEDPTLYDPGLTVEREAAEPELVNLNSYGTDDGKRLV